MLLIILNNFLMIQEGIANTTAYIFIGINIVIALIIRFIYNMKRNQLLSNIIKKIY